MHNVLFQSYLIFFVTVYKTTKQTKDCAPSGKSRKKKQQHKNINYSIVVFILMFAAFHKQSPRITMLFILLNETKSLLNTKKILRTAILDHVVTSKLFLSIIFSRLHDQTLYQCHVRQQEVAKGSNICL